MAATLALFGISFGALVVTVAAAGDIAAVVSATHWSPCYYINPDLPSLWDGAAALAKTGTTSIKLIASNSPESTYPWNTNWPAISESRGL